MPYHGGQLVLKYNKKARNWLIFAGVNQMDINKYKEYQETQDQQKKQQLAQDIFEQYVREKAIQNEIARQQQQQGLLFRGEDQAVANEDMEVRALQASIKPTMKTQPMDGANGMILSFPQITPENFKENVSIKAKSGRGISDEVMKLIMADKTFINTVCNVFNQWNIDHTREAAKKSGLNAESIMRPGSDTLDFKISRQDEQPLTADDQINLFKNIGQPTDETVQAIYKESLKEGPSLKQNPVSVPENADPNAVKMASPPNDDDDTVVNRPGLT